MPSLPGDIRSNSDIAAERQRVCVKCKIREATKLVGDAMVLNHGGGSWWCEVCLLEAQIAHAEERAAALPDLRLKLEALLRG